MNKFKKLSIVAVGVLLSFIGVAQEAIPLRGVVEGYYGRPWGTEGRLSLLKFMGEQDMNVFIYGPKDDPYHHSKWREAYPEKEMNDFKKLLDIAKKNKIHFYWAIHLGGAFNEKKEEDFAALNQKLTWMYEAGFRAFAVFFDDYGNADASAHARICNRLVKEFLVQHKDCAPLIMCPNVYCGSGSQYQKTLGDELDQKVNVMWTGRGICHDILASDIANVTRDLKRPPFIWWNWPVNDYCPSRLLLGRTYGLESAAISGFVTNPMENCEANKIALYSIAKWCKDPENFDSKKTWEESFTKIYSDPLIAKAMRIFAEHNSDQGDTCHGYHREESVNSVALCKRARAEFETTATLKAETRDELKKVWEDLHKAAIILKASLPKGRYDLGWELEGWLDAQITLMQEGFLTLDLISSDISEEKVNKLIKELSFVRCQGKMMAENHKRKFAAATFANARSRVVSPVASGSVFLPLIETMLQAKLNKIYEKKTGKTIMESTGFKSFSSVKSWESPIVIREDHAARLAPVMELMDVASGESFGLTVPAKWMPNNFYINLGDSKLLDKGVGVLEFSKDGETWCELSRNGRHIGLKPEECWRFVRFRNVSNETLKVKIVEFSYAIREAPQAIDELLVPLNSEHHQN